MKKSHLRIPYTYLIGWSKHNKWYYGRRTALYCNPSELWKTYFTSSNSVKKFREQYGEPDIIEIRKIFSDINRARIWEDTVLRRLKVVRSSKFLNRRNGDKSNLFNTSNTALAKTKDGDFLGPIDIDDPRWDDKSIVGIQYGIKRSKETRMKYSKSKKNKTIARNITTGNNEQVSIYDERWKTGEIVGINFNRKMPQTKEHIRKRTESRIKNKKPVSDATKKAWSEKRKGKRPAFDKDGNSLGLITKDDPRWDDSIFMHRNIF